MRVLVLTCFIVVCYTATITQQLCKVPTTQWFSVGQNYPTWLPSKFSTNLEQPLIFGKCLQSSAGTTPIYEHLRTMQEMMQHE